jgi:broad specificity phosphatase PhoE
VLSTCDLFLVRHGVTDWNETGRLMGRIDIGLNARGRGEAEALAHALCQFPLGTVAASPQRRTQETAEFIAPPHRLTIRTEAGLDEVWVKAHWQGKTRDELQGDRDLEQYLRDPTYRGDAIEPAPSVQDRVVAVAERLRADAEGAVLLISHGDPIKLLLAHHLSMDISAYRRLAIDTGSVSVLRFSRRSGNRLLVLNWKPASSLRALLD